MRRVRACCAISVSLAMVACPGKPPESAAGASPPPSASTSSSSPASHAPQPESDEQRLQGAVYVYCASYEACTGQTQTPCITMSMQYIETGCVKPMIPFYECAGAAPCKDGSLDTSDCEPARQAIDDCVAGKK